MDDAFIEKRNEMTRCALESGAAERFVELYSTSDELKKAEPWLYEASSGGNLNIVKFLLSQGHSPDERNSTRRKTPAIKAASGGGHHVIVESLIDAGATLGVDSIDDNALFSAIHARSLDCVKLLIDAGIDIHKVYDLGHRHKNALAFAEEEGCTDIAKYLREQGAVLPPAK